jgi:hypothetical protein
MGNAICEKWKVNTPPRLRRLVLIFDMLHLKDFKTSLTGIQR